MTTAKKTKKAKGKQAAETLSREYKGRTYTVSRNQDGTFGYDGQVYRSLTAVAKKVTGYASINGVAWFQVGQDGKAKD